MNENDPSFDYLENGIKLFILWEPVCRKASYVNTILGGTEHSDYEPSLE